jgi:hypothetical protein
VKPNTNGFPHDNPNSLLNYTTKISIEKTAAEITSILAGAGANAVNIEYENKLPAAAPVCGPACWDCPTAAYSDQTPEAIPNRRELSQPVRIDVPQDAPIEWSAFVRERAGK